MHVHYTIISYILSNFTAPGDNGGLNAANWYQLDTKSSFDNIKINIVAKPEANESYVRYTGENIDIIPKQEVYTFGIDDEKLKSAIEKYYGKKPHDVFLHSPTPWNLYEKYNWPETVRNLTVNNYRIRSFSKTQELLERRTIKNDREQPLRMKVTAAKNLTISTSVSWKLRDTLSVTDPIEIRIPIVDKKDGKIVTDGLALTVPWGKIALSGRELYITREKDVVIPPKTEVNVDYVIDKAKLTFDFKFLATLSGKVAVNYEPDYKGHRFYGFDIGEVMKAGGIPNHVEESMEVDIYYYIRHSAKIVTNIV